MFAVLAVLALWLVLAWGEAATPAAEPILSGPMIKLTPCGRTFLVHYVPDAPPMRTGHDGQRIHDERLGLTSAVLPAQAVSWALTTPRPLCLLAGKPPAAVTLLPPLRHLTTLTR